MTELFPVNEWISIYQTHKWKGHVFCPPEYQNEISKAAKEILQDRFEFEFNELAQDMCNLQ